MYVFVCGVCIVYIGYNVSSNCLSVEMCRTRCGACRRRSPHVEKDLVWQRGTGERERLADMYVFVCGSCFCQLDKICLQSTLRALSIAQRAQQGSLFYKSCLHDWGRTFSSGRTGTSIVQASYPKTGSLHRNFWNGCHYLYGFVSCIEVFIVTKELFIAVKSNVSLTKHLLESD